MKRSLRILLSNDDGVHAPGLEALEHIAAQLSDDVWVVAPETDQSGAARALTLSAPLRARPAGPRKFAIQGTPTDCVVMGVTQLLEGGPPDLILSGVNRGQNIAEDVTLSGTIAAAFQGMTLGVPSVALSQARFGRGEMHWETARRHGPKIIDSLLSKGWPRDVVVNVNFPAVEPDAVAGVEVTRQGHRDQLNLFTEKRTDLRGNDYFWMGFKGRLSNPQPGTDLNAVYEGRISVTPLHLSLTHDQAHTELGEHLRDYLSKA